MTMGEESSPRAPQEGLATVEELEPEPLLENGWLVEAL
jgi:hypothetical protein